MLTDGDFRLDNIFYSSEDLSAFKFVDWQIMRIDNPMFELSYFFAQSVPPAFRREHEETIITSYLQNLKRGGVEWEPLQMAMHYQAAHFMAFFCQIKTPDAVVRPL